MPSFPMPKFERVDKPGMPSLPPPSGIPPPRPRPTPPTKGIPLVWGRCMSSLDEKLGGMWRPLVDVTMGPETSVRARAARAASIESMVNAIIQKEEDATLPLPPPPFSRFSPLLFGDLRIDEGSGFAKWPGRERGTYS